MEMIKYIGGPVNGEIENRNDLPDEIVIVQTFLNYHNGKEHVLRYDKHRYLKEKDDIQNKEITRYDYDCIIERYP